MSGFGSAGHDPEAVASLLSHLEGIAERYHRIAVRVDEQVAATVFTDDPIGRDARKIAHEYRDSQIAELNDLQEGLQGLMDFAEDSAKIQREADQESAEAFGDRRGEG
ncbi:hypothetical protein [Segniliparus rugosus]|uniref:PE domain-containing protein n=1 Tax=Segniliparus rugosus (strain ATCC BAA-974 / DSM 45345 / CCUG 50838 / CIP 108380 / JCM 13579 / CDC 945) TaxID=679197 RepID=E5XPZ9_SEGRC|nr:hypothetical protein [Segniliparus rugosus]EFV13573.1 hypothetical protein HMPREF9336_01571 [Segniliparus rugosus ATCC BAA-974]